MSATRGRHPDPALERTWRDRLAHWQDSGLTVRAYCAREGLSEPSFYAWRRTLAGRDAVAAADAPAPAGPAFIPVHVLPPVVAPPLELVLRSGHTLRVPHGADPAQVRDLVTALEGRPC